jgi:ubiquinone/menaquinone biosynthesis C-methylase UbiE
MQRTFQEEAMDRPELFPQFLAGDLHNLEVLNTWFGGRGVVTRRLNRFLTGRPGAEPLSILDIGSGAGDLCRAMVDRCRTRGRPVRLCSLDLHPEIQSFARERSRRHYPEIRYVRGDATQLPIRDASVDLVCCTLALHHFAEPDAVRVLSEMRRVARGQVFVSDLERSRAAYVAVWFATRFTTNEMTRRDGPTSVARAFTGRELLTLATRAGWEKPRLQAEPWFRMTLTLDRIRA